LDIKNPQVPFHEIFNAADFICAGGGIFARHRRVPISFEALIIEIGNPHT
jgi:hypothetical protein